MIKIKRFPVALQKEINGCTKVRIDQLHHPSFTPEDLFARFSQILNGYSDLCVNSISVDVDDEGDGIETLSLSIVVRVSASDGHKFALSSGFVLFKQSGKEIITLSETASMFEDLLYDLKDKVLRYEKNVGS